LLSFCATRAFTSFLISAIGRGLSKGKWMVPLDTPPEATETISYRIPAFRHYRVLVWFAAFSNHCSLFPTASVIAAFQDELKGFSVSKGTIHFPLDKPLPIALIKKLVKARVAQNESKKPRPPAGPLSGSRGQTRTPRSRTLPARSLRRRP
jgi:uncharacterized protein YdhG (YjbR/CyaY superfamily)